MLNVSIPSFVLQSTVAVPPGSTHLRLVSAGAELDFGMGSFNGGSSMSLNIVLGHDPIEAINLNINLNPNSTLQIVLAFGVEFWQIVNGKMYRLNSNDFNAISIVAVSPAP